jgi:type VI protein secretion system component VasK
MKHGGTTGAWSRAAALAVALVVLAASPVLGVESAADLPPDADPMATIAVVIISAGLVSVWTSYRARRTSRR